MSRPRVRTTHLMPSFIAAAQRWGIARARDGRRALKLEQFSDNDYWRIVRGDPASEVEVQTMQQALIEYGREHNMTGWEDLR